MALEVEGYTLPLGESATLAMRGDKFSRAVW